MSHTEAHYGHLDKGDVVLLDNDFSDTIQVGEYREAVVDLDDSNGPYVIFDGYVLPLKSASRSFPFYKGVRLLQRHPRSH